MTTSNWNARESEWLDSLDAAYGLSTEMEYMMRVSAAEQEGEVRAEWFYGGGNPDDTAAFASQWLRTGGTMIEESS